MIEINNITKRYGDKTALDSLTMTVPSGSVFGLVGPNGAGKSTLLRIITGVFKADSGNVTLDGELIFENPAVKQKIAYIPDDVFYFPASSLNEMSKFYRGMYPQYDEALYDRLLQVFQLDPKMQIRRYSKGMQKQAAFILSICCRPELLILDEPVDGLDPVARRQVWSILLQDAAERGTTVLVSSHNLRELEDVCDYVGILHLGKLLLERSLSELQDNAAKIQTVFGADGIRPKGLKILHESVSGSVHTLIVRGNMGEIRSSMDDCCPVFYDLIPLSLEEIFIYELGGENHGIQSILL